MEVFKNQESIKEKLAGMTDGNLTVSIIIPTHNRMHSTKRLLDKLAKQTYPIELMEVVAVANSCTDDTITMLQNHDAPYKFQFAETSGDGPAVARNKGASIATGKILIFLDDDIDPSEGLVEGHVAMHEKENTVVIGYLPFPLLPKSSLFKLHLRFWWEDKFYQMRLPGYRFSYEDLLSGNFSISARFFNSVKGFILGYSCRDDYELGIRLINAGAEIKFSKNAWGYHRDEVTDLKRSLKRKKEEGKTDIKIWRLYPDIKYPIQSSGTLSRKRKIRLKLFLALLSFPKLSDFVLGKGIYILNLLEYFRMRGMWKRLNTRFHTYWYIRGLQDELGSKQQLIDFLTPPKNDKEADLHLDLSIGIEKAEQLLDEHRPSGLKVMYGEQLVGVIPYEFGAEPITGKHLRRILAKEMPKKAQIAMALNGLLHKQSAINNLKN